MAQEKSRDNAKIDVHDDGSATVYTGTSPHGQGHDTAWSMITSEQTGIPMDKITLVWGDTDLVPEGGGTMGSRSLQHGGVAVHEAAEILVEKARQQAASLLEADEAEIDGGAEAEAAINATGLRAVIERGPEIAGVPSIAFAQSHHPGALIRHGTLVTIMVGAPPEMAGTSPTTTATPGKRKKRDPIDRVGRFFRKTHKKAWGKVKDLFK